MGDKRNGQPDYGSDGGNSATFAEDLNRGSGGGESPGKEYMRYDSSDPDHAISGGHYEDRREQARMERMMMDELYDEGIVATREMILNRLRGNLARGGYARKQAILVDTGIRVREEQRRDKAFRTFTPEMPPKADKRTV